VDRKKHGDGPEETAASLVFKSLQKELGMNFPEDEAYLLASVLRSAKRISETDIENVIGLTSLASVLIEDVTRTTGYFFSKDKKFLDALVSHLEPLFNRIAEGVFVPNPIKREIKEDYSVLFGTIGTVLKEKFPELEFSEDEIGFLTLHFASAITEFKEVPKVATLVVCTSGLATSRMLTKKLLMKFPQLTIIEQGSIRELHKMDPKDFDLIISTVGIHDAGFEYILVNPMLSSEDELKLEKVINRKLLSSTRKRDEGVKESKLSEQGLLKTIEIVGDAGQAVKEILEGFAISETDGSDISSVLRGIEGDLMILLGTDTANESISMLLEKENATGSGIPESDITLLHGRNSRLDRMIFRIYRNKAKVKVKGMDSKMMESGTFLLLLTPELLTGPRLEMVSALSVSLLEKDIRKTY
jgi:mannitol operon transcriptional antiterminator